VNIPRRSPLGTLPSFDVIRHGPDAAGCGIVSQVDEMIMGESENMSGVRTDKRRDDAQ
jgi:hypothetical protein